MIDITVKSGIRAFAPDWDWLMAYKHGDISHLEYSRLYHAKVIGNFERDQSLWREFLSHPDVAIACYCRAGGFCHRYLFTNLLAQYLQSEGRKVVYQGELMPPL